MKIFYSLRAEFECVYLINGAFNENPKAVQYPAMSPLYVTLLPLKAVLLPYTVKLLAGKAVSNGDLAECYEVAADHYAAVFRERHNYVYSPAHVTSAMPEKGLAPAFYRAVKAGDLETARHMMTKDLSESIDDDSLTAFFSPYCNIVENRFSDLSGGFFLINKSSMKGEPFDFEISGERISDISQI